MEKKQHSSDNPHLTVVSFWWPRWAQRWREGGGQQHRSLYRRWSIFWSLQGNQKTAQEKVTTVQAYAKVNNNNKTHTHTHTHTQTNKQTNKQKTNKQKQHKKSMMIHSLESWGEIERQNTEKLSGLCVELCSVFVCFWLLACFFSPPSSEDLSPLIAQGVHYGWR